MSKSAVAKASTIVYFGPSDTLYCRVGSIDANETVEVHAKELNYYYITYTAGSTKKTRICSSWIVCKREWTPYGCNVQFRLLGGMHCTGKNSCVLWPKL